MFVPEKLDALLTAIDCGRISRSDSHHSCKRSVREADRRDALQLSNRPIKTVQRTHSKYNRIERCWSALERHWNGSPLRTLDKAVGWAKSMTWNALAPIVGVATKIYAKGVEPRTMRIAGPAIWVGQMPANNIRSLICDVVDKVAFAVQSGKRCRGGFLCTPLRRATLLL